MEKSTSKEASAPLASPPYGPACDSQAVGGLPPLGSQPTHVICPHCQAEVDTVTKSRPSSMAWLSGLILCLFGCCLGCCLIPCCITECKDVEHRCPNCNGVLGRYRRL